MMTVQEALSQGSKAISQTQVSATPLLDASLLLCKTTDLRHAELYSQSLKTLSEETVEAYHALVKRRCEAEPVAYLVGYREFYGRQFLVSPSVLIPRPDSETLVEAALERLSPSSESAVLDLCCGSGCIGLTLACERPKLDLTLSDISKHALLVAQQNNLSLLKGQAKVVESDLFEAFRSEKFALIVTNPPYLTSPWYNACEKQVKREPSLALLGGDSDGLALIRRIVDEAGYYLLNGGSLLIECDWRQNATVTELLVAKGFSDVKSYSDLAALKRVVGGTFYV
ncbi:MAG: peptide chain release factor N(5)-glutamine methyltransferase [Sphaerochaetaceae bacterium]